MWYLQVISFLLALLFAFFFSNMRSQDTMVYSYNPQTGEFEAGVLQVWGQLGLYKESLSPNKSQPDIDAFSFIPEVQTMKRKATILWTIYLELWLNAGPTNIYFMMLVCLTFALSKHNQWGPPEVDWPSVLCHIDEAWGFSSSSGVTDLKDLVKITVLLFCVDVFQGQSRFWRGRHTHKRARMSSLLIYHLCHSQGFYDKVRSKGKTKHTYSLHISCDTSVFIRKWTG